MYKSILTLFVCLLSIPSFALKIAVLSDVSGTEGKISYRYSVPPGISAIIQDKVDLILAPGDFVGSQGHYSTERLLKLWKGFDNRILKYFKSSQIPFAPSPGNHDASLSFPNSVKHYKKFFKKKENTPKIPFLSSQQYPFYYSFLIDNILFISLQDSQTYRLANGETQKKWLIEQLKSDQAKKANKIIVYGHIPLYSVLERKYHDKKSYPKTAKNNKFHEVLEREQDLKGRSNTLEEILRKYKVDLFISAHSHVFYNGHIIQPHREAPLHNLFMPCLGDGARYVSTQNTRSKQGYILINIEDDKINIIRKEYNGAEISEPLPKKIISNNGIVIKKASNL